MLDALAEYRREKPENRKDATGYYVKTSRLRKERGR